MSVPVDELPDESNIRSSLKAVVLEGPWYLAYDLLEFSVNEPTNGNRERLAMEIDRILKEEWAGFRLTRGQFVEITSEEELSAIEAAMNLPDQFASTRKHLETALALLSDRRSPDYRNSIKESISAVEAVTQVLSGDRKAELGKALKLIEQKVPLHGGLKSALRSLYGYTSDADGIRHALQDGPSLDSADAKFMLVVCAAFVTYLTQKAA